MSVPAVVLSPQGDMQSTGKEIADGIVRVGNNSTDDEEDMPYNNGPGHRHK